MYNEKYYPFYMNFTTPEFWEEERLQARENQLMQSLYPKTARRIQEKVLEECDRIDYPGSIIYDEYPDRFMMEQLCRKIRTGIESEDMAEGDQVYVEAEQRHDRRPDNLLDELIHVLLFQEMRRRRCRNHRCRRYF